MFVTNHALSGVLIGQVLSRHPVAAFATGLASHLVLDAVPHWGCDYFQPGGQEKFLRAARADGVSGLTVMAVASVVVGRRSRAATLAAMVGAVALDLDKPLWHFFRVKPFPEAINRLHHRVQNESEDGLPLELGYAVAFAILDTLAISAKRYTSSLSTSS